MYKRDKCITNMNQLTEIQTIRFSKEDVKLLNRLKELKIKQTAFIRIALREKIQRDLPKILKKENNKEYCPF